MEKHKNREWLYQKYIVEKEWVSNIAKICNVSDVTIYNWLRKHNIEIRSVSETLTGRKLSEESIKKRIITLKKNLTPERRKKQSDFMKEQWKNKESRDKMLSNRVYLSGPKSYGWKGDKAGVDAMHRHVEKIKKKPNQCEECGKEKCRLELSNKDHTYSRDPIDYRYLCRSCHVKYDHKKGIWGLNGGVRKLRGEIYIPKIRKKWYDDITRENTKDHLIWIRENRHIRNYYRHKKKLKELGLID